MNQRHLALAAFSVWLIATPAAAWERTGIPNAPDSCLHWEDRSIRWSPAGALGGNVPQDEAMEEIRRSFATWEGESCTDLRFVEGPPVARRIGYSQRGGNANAVLFRERNCADLVANDDPCHAELDCANRYDCWDFGSNLIAVTTTTFSQCSGRIVDADIEFNGGRFDFTTGDGEPCAFGERQGCVATDLRNTMVHEIGHLIGLDHSDDRDATMYASAPPGEVQKRDLAPDDIAGFCGIYPAGGPTSTCAPARPLELCGEGSGSSGASSGGCAAGGGGLAAIGLLPAWAWARRRRS